MLSPTKGINPMNHFLPLILDTTLRDGEQTPGVVFNLKDKLILAGLLDKAGIQEAEIGFPAIGNAEIEDMREIIGLGLKLRTISWCRAVKSDIDLAVKTGTHGVHMSFPASAIHLQSMGKSEKWVIRSLHELIPYAADRFKTVTIGIQDASRTDIRFLKEIIHELVNYTITRIRIADTVGILNPFNTFDLIGSLCHDFSSVNIEFHGHNDLGMATANSIAAYKAGAVCIDTTVNGLGERAGNTPMDEFVMAMQHSLGIRLPIHTELFSELASTAAIASGIPVPVNKPVTGSGVFQHESGIHTNLILKNLESYQIIPAASVGRKEEEFIFGKHCGVHALRAFIQKNNLSLAEENCEELVKQIKSEAIRLKRSLTIAELFALL
jgi:homocitrate synthase NifV